MTSWRTIATNARRAVGWLAALVVMALAAAGIWRMAGELQGVDSLDGLVPTASELRTAWDDFGLELRETFIPNTLRVTLFGFAIALVLGLIFAAVMDLLPPLRWALYPLLIVSQTVPTFAVAVLLILVFGFGDGPKIVVVILFCFYAVTINTYDGLRSVDRDQVALLRTMGANRLQIWWKVNLPGALPSFFGGARLAATYAVVGAVIGEYVGSGEGLGKFLQRSYRSFETGQVFLAVGIIAALSIALVGIVSLVEVLALRWRYTDDLLPNPRWWRRLRERIDSLPHS